MLGLPCVIKCVKFVQILPKIIINQTIRCTHTKEALQFCKSNRSQTMQIVYTYKTALSIKLAYLLLVTFNNSCDRTKLILKVKK